MNVELFSTSQSEKNVWVISSVVKTLNIFAGALKCIFSLMRFGDA